VTTVHDFFATDRVVVAALGDFLDALPPRERVEAVRDLSASEQARLFDAAAGFRRVTLEDFVPTDVPPLRPVVHHGRNSLLAFRTFEKRFCRPPGAAPDALWGYNEQPFRLFTGPGYFVARRADDREVLIDYTELPPAKPESWPPILPNSARLSRFIYDGTRDFMRGVSRHVTIGRATRAGKPMDNWFVLCREEAS
jgi:hypothetical protein